MNCSYKKCLLLMEFSSIAAQVYNNCGTHLKRVIIFWVCCGYFFSAIYKWIICKCVKNQGVYLQYIPRTTGKKVFLCAYTANEVVNSSIILYVPHPKLLNNKFIVSNGSIRRYSNRKKNWWLEKVKIYYFINCEMLLDSKKSAFFIRMLYHHTASIHFFDHSGADGEIVEKIDSEKKKRSPNTNRFNEKLSRMLAASILWLKYFIHLLRWWT